MRSLVPGLRGFVAAVQSLALVACLTGDPNIAKLADAGPSPDGPVPGSSSSGSSTSSGGGAIGDSLNIVSPGDQLSFADADLPAGKTARTIEAWVRTTLTGEGYVVSYGSTSAGGAYLLGVLGGRGVLTQIGDSVVGSKPIGDGRWHHLAATFEGGSGQCSLFVDGAPEGQKVMLVDTVKGGTAWIGSWVPQGKTATGAIDEVRIWSVARTQAQLQADMSRRLGGAEPGLVAYFGMNAGGKGPGISVPNLAVGASIKAAITEGSTIEFLPASPF